MDDITLERGVLERAGEIVRAAAPAHRYALIADGNVAPLYAARVLRSLGSDARLFEAEPGEANKTRAAWAVLTDAMLAAGFGRDAAVVALGGGVVGDLAGFVAATYMRGIPVVQVPTTLLAMIDAAIGGKTGVDTSHGKNLVGAFHAPAAVLIDPDVLATLPVPELRAGMAEAIKHGVIADRAYFERVAAAAPSLLAPGGTASGELDALIAGSVAIKTDVVRLDAREGGLRKTLNFGHTIGHAVESVLDYGILHGEAVAIGMALEAELAERIGIAEVGTADGIRQALRGAGLPFELPPEAAPDRVIAATRSDKKARVGRVEYALPLRIGAMAGAESGWGIPVDDADVAAILGV